MRASHLKKTDGSGSVTPRPIEIEEFIIIIFIDKIYQVLQLVLILVVV